MTRTITIHPVLNGFIVQVGCQQVVFQSRELLIDELERYLKTPALVEKTYLTDAVNKDLIPQQIEPGRPAGNNPVRFEPTNSPEYRVVNTGAPPAPESSHQARNP